MSILKLETVLLSTENANRAEGRPTFSRTRSMISHELKVGARETSLAMYQNVLLSTPNMESDGKTVSRAGEMLICARRRISVLKRAWTKGMAELSPRINYVLHDQPKLTTSLRMAF